MYAGAVFGRIAIPPVAVIVAPNHHGIVDVPARHRSFVATPVIAEEFRKAMNLGDTRRFPDRQADRSRES